MTLFYFQKFVKKCTTECKETQTDGFDQITPSNEGVWNSAVQNAGKSIADEVKEAAENALKHTSFVYEPTSGMYYDYSTGYYYDAVRIFICAFNSPHDIIRYIFCKFLFS